MMKFAVSSVVVFCALASLASSIDVPAVGSADNTSCAGGVVTKASTFKSLKGDDILMKEVACPAGSLKAERANTSLKSGRLLAREEIPAVNTCDVTCENNGEVALVADCEDLEDALIEDSASMSAIIFSNPDRFIFSWNRYMTHSTVLHYESLITLPADPLIVAPDSIIFFALGTCEMNYENLLESEDNSIPKSNFGFIGVTISETCFLFGTGLCVSDEDDYAFATVSTAG